VAVGTIIPKSRMHSLASRRTRGALGLLVLLLFAEVFTRARVVDPSLLPAASVILLRVAQLVVDPEFMTHLAATMRAWLIGLLASVTLAVPLGVLLGSWRVANAASRALIEFLRPIPSVALVPVAILLFGHGTEMKVSLIVYAATWPILFNTIYGLHEVDPTTKDTARSFGFGRLSILARVSVPSALPFMYTGLRIAAGIALILAISAELLAGGREGIGIWMLQATAGLRPDLLYAATVITGLLGWAINAGMMRAERRVLAWQPALRRTG
jgi:NitT/TauT family transport system permease protein